MKRKLKIKELLFEILIFFFKRKKSNFNNKITKILVVRQDNRIGNMLFITPLLKLIFEVYNVKSDVLVGGRFYKIIDSNPNVNKTLVYNQKEFIKKPWKFIKFILEMRKVEYDIVIDCKNAFSFNNSMLTLISKGKIKLGFENNLSDKYLDFSINFDELLKENKHEYEYLAMLLLRFINENREIPKMEYYYSDKELDKKSYNIVIHIGGRGEKSLKANLINELVEEILKKEDKVAIIYGPNEIDKVNNIKNLKGVIKINPKSIDELAYYIEKSEWFITPDTGALHIASALNKNIIALFYNKTFDRYGPVTTGKSIVIKAFEKLDSEILNEIISFFRKVN
ncbi:glycosyltransferase family 9 protein [Haliovirga abyssi]|uniref:Lipopolysaccharide heptosyltransferase family protein n=1 Tax=Haliovirga abyssi TaxID=2996794 RepID=A0AAU9DWP3_9FUSO|nr:glycosyltransferase family 9 protein [Haliovirga abyssi]BDU49685.1 hypothetical protein HLVA_02540 [Haliovirga abyssi]